MSIRRGGVIEWVDKTVTCFFSRITSHIKQNWRSIPRLCANQSGRVTRPLFDVGHHHTEEEDGDSEGGINGGFHGISLFLL